VNSQTFDSAGNVGAEWFRALEFRHSGPKGRNMPAQGNALGNGHFPTVARPEGAQQGD